MKIYVKGFFFANLGDDLFVHMIAKRYPQHKFIVVVNKEYADTFSSVPNVEIIALNKAARAINKFYNIYDVIEKKADITVVISGSIFQEFPNDTNAVSRFSRLPGKNNPTYIIGTNFGPYQTNAYFQAAKRYFAGVKDVCFRDKWSYELFKDMEQIRYAPDIIFGVEKLVDDTLIKEKRCSISVMDFDNKEYLKPYRESYERFLVKIMEYYIARDYEITLLSFCRVEGDELAIDRIVKKLPAEILSKICVKKYNGTNWKEIIAVIRSSSYLVASRFHSMILGSVFQVPVLPIIYNDKTIHAMNDIGCGNYGIKLNELDGYSIENAEYMLIHNIDCVKTQAEEQFKVLDSVLLKKG